ncbi:MAG: hypothetical protein H6622_10970 [Halobacteriovoraceae bacterium]|nr:hypothetical protein [Halobacteriovoraceae bacterium]
MQAIAFVERGHHDHLRVWQGNMESSGEVATMCRGISASCVEGHLHRSLEGKKRKVVVALFRL